MRENLGLDVSFRGAWITAVDGAVDLQDVVFRVPNQPDSTFSIGRVVISGPVEGLILGKHTWPTQISISEPGPIRAHLDQSGLRPAGALADVVDQALATLRQRERARASSSQPEPSDTQSIPAIRLFSSPLLLENPATGIPLLTLNLQQAVFAPALEGSKDYRVEFTGILGTGTPALAQGTLRYHAADRLWEAGLFAENLDGSFPVEGALRRMWWQVRGFRTAARISRPSAGGLLVTLAASAQEARLANGVNGTRPLFRGPLNLSAQTFAPENTTSWTLQSLRLSGPDVDVALSGQVDARPPHRFSVDVGLSRIPGRVYHLAREELADQKASFDFPTTAGLNIQAHVTGRPDQLHNAALSGQISLDAVRFSHPLLPSPLLLEQIEGELATDGAQLDIGRWRLGELGGSASGRLTGLPMLGRAARLETRFLTSGSAEELVRLGRTIHVLPPEVERFEAAVRGEGTFATNLVFDRGRLLARNPDWAAQVSWVDGRLALTEWHDVIELETGALRISPAALEILRLRSRGGGVDIRWSGAVTGSQAFWIDPQLRCDAEGETTVPALARLLDFGGVGLAPLRDIQGKLRVNLAWDGPLSRPERGEWKADVRARDIQFPLTLRGETARVHNVNFDARLTSRGLDFDSLRARIDDMELEGRIRADDTRIRLDASLRAPVETALRLFREDLAEFRGQGVVPVELTASLDVVKPLPEPDLPLVARWARLLATPGAVQIDDTGLARPSLAATLYPDGASFWHEEMPHPITNIRGRVTADLGGLQIHNVLSQWGDITDCSVNGRVIVPGFPVKVLFEIEAPRLQIMDWVEGWGHPPDGRQARSVYRDPDKPLPSRLMTILEGSIRAKEVRINRLKGANGRALLRYENWRGRENTLDIQNINISGYDGSASGTIQMTMEGRGINPRFTIQGQFFDLQVQPFINDLFDNEDKTVGRLHGFLQLGGRFGDLSTFVGEGSVLLRNTRVLGGPVFPLLGKILKATVVEDITFSSIRGAYRIEKEKVVFERLFLDSPGVRLLGLGSVGFLGDMDMDVSAGFYSQTLNKIPGFSAVTSLFRDLGASFLKFHVTGTLAEPRLAAVPFSADVVERMFSGADQAPSVTPPPPPTPTPRPPFVLGDGF